MKDLDDGPDGLNEEVFDAAMSELTPDVPWPGLTPRERQVAEMICEGKGRREIAALLGCKANTVDAHRGRALTKLGVGGVVKMALLAAKNGWVQL